MKNSLKLELKEKLACNIADHPQLRYGQALFNALHEVDPDLANDIRGGDLDPFYWDYPHVNSNPNFQKFWRKVLTK